MSEADKMSFAGRVSRVIVATACISLMGGAVFGWPSMRAILRRDAVLRDGGCHDLDPAQQCTEQELALAAVYTVGAWANLGGRFFVGLMLDLIGPRLSSTVCASTFTIGTMIFGITESTGGLTVGYFLIGIGGAGMQLSVQSVSALFPSNRNFVMSIFSGAFMTASGVFLVFDLLHESADVPRAALMFGYGVVAALVAVVSFAIWPDRPFGVPSAAKSSGTAVPSHHNALGREPSAGSDVPKYLAVPLNKQTFRNQLFSREFRLMACFFLVNVLQCQFSLGNLGTQFEIKGDARGELTRFFNAALSLAWVSTPVMGHLMDRWGFPRVLMLVNTFLLAFCLCLLSSWLPLQYVACLVYAFARTSLWATFFSFVGSVFGFAHFGKLAGGGLLLASCFSLLQFPLLAVTLGPFGGDFTIVNSLFVVTTCSMYFVIHRLSSCLAGGPSTRAGKMCSPGNAAEAVCSREQPAGTATCGKEATV